MHFSEKLCVCSLGCPTISEIIISINVTYKYVILFTPTKNRKEKWFRLALRGEWIFVTFVLSQLISLFKMTTLIELFFAFQIIAMPHSSPQNKKPSHPNSLLNHGWNLWIWSVKGWMSTCNWYICAWTLVIFNLMTSFTNKRIHWPWETLYKLLRLIVSCHLWKQRQKNWTQTFHQSGSDMSMTLLLLSTVKWLGIS